MSKKQRIQELTADGLTAAEIAEELDTTKNYVYKARSSGNGQQPSEPSPTTAEQTEPDVSDSSESSTETLELGDTDAEDRDSPDGDVTADDVPDDTPDTESMELEDDGGKSYECGSCDASLDYLQKTCDNCGARPAWSVIDA